MEFALARSGPSGHGGGVLLREEKRHDSSGGDEEGLRKEETDVEVPPMAETGPAVLPDRKEEVDELESAKAEMGEVREENQRLKICLDRVLKDYRTLQMQFHDIVELPKQKMDDKGKDYKEPTVEPEFVSLSLGRVPSNPKSGDKTVVSKSLKEEFKEDLALGLDCKFETSKSGTTTEALPNPSPTISSEVQKEEAGVTWPPSKVLKTFRDAGKDEVSQQNPAKKARVCIRARCDTTTMNDGCQWRKYGQKIAKGNPCPRAYYRCTIGTSCPVRKQVQRCAEDMSILIITYEGTHNHPLPLSATAIASATSAAASMLSSGSSSSYSGSMPSTATSTAADLHGLNFYLSDGSKSRQFYLSNAALSSSPSHPTITLDLTSNLASSSSHFGRFSSNYNPPRYPSSTSLSFSSSESNNKMSWSNGFLSYGTQPYNNVNRNVLSTMNLARQPMENMYQSYMQKNNNPNFHQHSLPDTIAAATKAITADPKFQSALAAALASIIGTGSGTIGGSQENESFAEILGQKMKSGELFPASSTLPSTSKVNGCASSFLNKTVTNAQTGSLMFLPPSLPFSSSKSASAAPGDNRDSTN